MDLHRLRQLHAAQQDRQIVDLFAADAARADTFSVSADALFFDYSKTLIDAPIRNALLDLAQEAGVAAQRDAMFAGARINTTEGRAVLHTALRDPQGPPLMVANADVRPAIRDTLAHMAYFAQEIRRGDAFDDVINIGIGGSDLGPAMATAALAPFADGPRMHFVSNIDGAHLADTLAGLNPRRTLVIVVSKTFTTIETMTNADSARRWMQAGGGAPDQAFAAVSSARDRTAAFGIPPSRVFGFGDWVGGRYSIWGPVGLALMIAIGPDHFADFLAGGRAMDRHFCTAPPDANMPMMLALTGLWHAQVAGHPTRAVLPYDQRLALLPAYLQQLEMESNGKGVTQAGTPAIGQTGPVIWGAPGTNGQHAFYQLLHQGTQVVPCEFMLAKQGHEPHMDHHHRLLVANCLAQSEALMRGRTTAEVEARLCAAGMAPARAAALAPHRTFPGNRPSTTLLWPRLTPFVLGQLIALYEHRVFVEGVILGLNSFDQWGVELGKEMATAMLPLLAYGADDSAKDGSTRALLRILRQD